jgi:excisionase family DNA binding protein
MEQGKPSPRNFLTPREFWERHRLSRSTVYEGLRNGSIPSIRIAKKKILIPEDALEQKLEAEKATYFVRSRKRW